MSINRIVLFLLMLLPVQLVAHENHLINRGGEVEIVYMFSYACPTCRLMSPYISTWEKVFPELMPLPVFSTIGDADNWRNAARRRFVLHALRKEGVVKLTPVELDKIGYSILDEEASTKIEDQQDVLKFLNGWGIKPSESSLSGAWQLSEMYMQDAELMVTRIKSERGKIATPIFRISSGMGIEYVVIDPEHEDPPMDFLQRASDVVRKHKNHLKAH